MSVISAPTEKLSLPAPGRSVSFASRLGWVILFIAPALWIARLISQYGVDFPYWDQWDGICPIFIKFHEGTLSFSDLMAFHNEHRIFFPRLLYLALGLLTHWNVRAELFLIWGLALLCSFNLWKMSRVTGWAGSRLGAWLLIAMNCLLFTPTQFENWLLGMEVQFLLQIVCMTASLWVAVLPRTRTAFLGTMALATISTYSNASGFLCWIFTLPILLFRDGKPAWRARRGWWVAWGTTFLLTVFLYFVGYKKPAHHPTTAFVLQHPVSAIEYLLVYLGADFLEGVVVAMACGAILMLLLGICVAGLWIWRRDEELISRSLPWLMLPGFALANGALTAIGRLGFGIVQALAPRYIIFSILFPIGLLFILPLVLVRIRAATSSAAMRGLLAGAVALVLGSLAVLHTINAAGSLDGWVDMQLYRLRGKAALNLINVVGDNGALAMLVHPDAGLLKIRANALNRLGYLHPALLPSAQISNIADPTEPGSAEFGAIEKSSKVGPKHFGILGWAVLPGKMRPADGVLFTCDNEEGQPVIFQVAGMGTSREDVAAALHESDCTKSGWMQIFDISQLPKGAKVVKAWAYDAELNRAYRIKGEAPVPSAQ